MSKLKSPSLSKELCEPSTDGKRYNLNSARALPKASSFLWNKKMLLQLNCRGYATAKYLEADTSKYSYAPNIEARTFFQPEQPFYAHHPGRFFYLYDVETDKLVSAPYEPVRCLAKSFLFSVGQTDIQWEINFDDVILDIKIELAEDEVLEKWSVKVRNTSDQTRQLQLFPYFSIGFMSWMNQSARFNPSLNGIIADCVTPYQKLVDYDRIKSLKDKTFLLCDQIPDGWETSQERFEGEGGISDPDGIRDGLSNQPAHYVTPVALLQFDMELAPSSSKDFRFLFGPAKTTEDIFELKERHFGERSNSPSKEVLGNKLEACRQRLQIETPDEGLNNYVNSWLPRQLYMHGHVNRLTLDPQTRNYLQDNMGMSYLEPAFMRAAICKALSQQNQNGSLPDGILLDERSQLNYINQIPHTDHNIWLPVCLEAYLDETDDYSILEKEIIGDKSRKSETVFTRITRAMDWLIENKDHRGLSLILQGDWCDPMNMVGPKGRGVSGWLTIATTHALNIWTKVANEFKEEEIALRMQQAADGFKRAAHTHLWDENWFVRGISDDGVVFGKRDDLEGMIFLNPQSWAIMSEIATADQIKSLLEAVETHLVTPYGAELLSPPFTHMHEHIGRVTQKFPGSAENGSVYNHASIFYVCSLYQLGETDKAYDVLRSMLPSGSKDDLQRRGQLPTFIPNYYRGAFKEIPEMAGRSSHMFNTGTISWFYRCIVEELIGFKGVRNGLKIDPKIPSYWSKLRAKRVFRDAIFHVEITRSGTPSIKVDGDIMEGNILKNIIPGKSYQIDIVI